MLNNMTCRTNLNEWQDLQDHSSDISNTPIKELFIADDNRFQKFSHSLGPLLFDYSKQEISTKTIGLLAELAETCDLDKWKEKLFNGAAINTTEKRAVLHTSLRSDNDKEIFVQGQNIVPLIKSTLSRMKNCSEEIRGQKKFRHIINIGIGGSHLGTEMAVKALSPYLNTSMSYHFVSNVDSAQLTETLKSCDPRQTLFIIASKTFTTQETMINANSAKEWLKNEIGSDNISEHFIATTKNINSAKEFGVKEENIFPIWDWVGGRFSIWSAIGFPLCIALGANKFQEFLDGAHTMDEHFMNAPFDKNIPILMAMIGVWNHNFLKYNAHSVAPYSHHLSLFAKYQQQLDMESNGKSVDRNNMPVNYTTGPIIFGESGTDCQHSYFQSLHQGTQIIPCDFIVVANTENQISTHQRALLANVFAQSKAMMEGKKSDDPHTSFAGNRPSNTLILRELTPYSLGMLIALYEQKIFVQGVIWNINSFDQCGVELGKILANDILNTPLAELNTDSSTLGLLKYATDKS